MALRVLLADESSTIKKAVQMALSDLGVEVKSVPSGLDVLTVATTYTPHIVLADVLLTKKNGYEVCQELKNDSRLKNIPVVLMWSSFLQLDHELYKKVKADTSLEKPFDSETLRDIIEKYVPQFSRSPLRELLNHPDLPDFEESETFVRQKSEFENKNSTAPSQAKPTETKVEAKPSTNSISRPAPAKTSSPIKQEFTAESIDQSLDEIEEFSEMPLKPRSRVREETEEEWSQNPVSNNPPAASKHNDDFIVKTESFGDFEEVTVLTGLTKNNEHSAPDLQRRIEEQVRSYVKGSPVAQNKSTASFSRPSSELDEQIMKEEIRLMAEKICWQILPEITERIVREEIGKLLNGLEKV